MDQKLFTEVEQALYKQLPTVLGLGVRAIALCGRLIGNIPGFECILLADELLAQQVLEGADMAYLDTLPLMYRKIFEGMQSFAPRGVAFCRSEPLVIGLNDTVARATGMQYRDDYYHVPTSNFACAGNIVGETDEEILAPLDTWGRFMATDGFFNSDHISTEHKMWIQLSLLPFEGDRSVQLCRRSALVTQLGWNMFTHGEQDPKLIPHAYSLKESIEGAEANGWMAL